MRVQPLRFNSHWPVKQLGLRFFQAYFTINRSQKKNNYTKVNGKLLFFVPMKRNFFFITLFLLFPLCTYAGGAKNGVLDLRDWNPQTNIVTLSGQWDFYANTSSLEELSQKQDTKRLVTLPHIWKDDKTPSKGFAAYQLKIYCLKNQQASPCGSMKFPAPTK